MTHNAQQLKKMLSAAPAETREDFGVAMAEAEQFFRGVMQQKSDQLPEPLDPRLLACFRWAATPTARGKQMARRKKLGSGINESLLFFKGDSGDGGGSGGGVVVGVSGGKVAVVVV